MFNFFLLWCSTFSDLITFLAGLNYCNQLELKITNRIHFSFPPYCCCVNYNHHCLIKLLLIPKLVNTTFSSPRSNWQHAETTNYKHLICKFKNHQMYKFGLYLLFVEASCKLLFLHIIWWNSFCFLMVCHCPSQQLD